MRGFVPPPPPHRPGSVRMAIHRGTRGYPPLDPPPPPRPKGPSWEKNEIDERENLVGPFLVHKLWSGGSVGTSDRGQGKGSREGKIGQGGGGMARGGERLMGTTACGGKGSRGRAVSGDRPMGAARCRREQYTEGDMPTPPPPLLSSNTSLPPPLPFDNSLLVGHLKGFWDAGPPLSDPTCGIARCSFTPSGTAEARCRHRSNTCGGPPKALDKKKGRGCLLQRKPP